MLTDPLITQLVHSCADPGGIEAGPSEAGRPAGSAPGGADFETEMSDLWLWMLRSLAARDGVETEAVVSGATTLAALTNPKLGTQIVVGFRPDQVFGARAAATTEVPRAWGESRFLVSDLVDWHMGDGQLYFAPPTAKDSPRFHGQLYPQMFQGFNTCFDFNVVLALNGQLMDKMLFEYKSAKSSAGDRLDGNAHERLGFQVLQYLEIANHLGNTSLNVVASSAFARYRNKYHVAFNQQAVRLGNTYATFVMRFASCPTEYAALMSIVAGFLLHGFRPPRDFREWVTRFAAELAD